MGDAIDYEGIVDAAERAKAEWNMENSESGAQPLSTIRFWGMEEP